MIGRVGISTPQGMADIDFYSSVEVKKILKNKHVVFMGDSLGKLPYTINNDITNYIGCRVTSPPFLVDTLYYQKTIIETPKKQ